MLTMSVRENSNETARLHLDTARLPNIKPLDAAFIDISPRFSVERGRVETFIKDIYLKNYGARIGVNYPILMSVRNHSGDILAAMGFRYAAAEPLFLENYIGKPVERALTDLYKTEVRRRDVVEIGNLASGGGASVFLFAALSAYLGAQNILYATITGTDFLHRRLRKMGLKPHKICDANPTFLTNDEREQWGSYYDTAPRVLAGSVSEGVRHLQQALGAVYENLPLLYSRLHFKGGA